ncbi:hypothetical protein J6590_102192, partial [Homalodisca vitripennis]
NPSYHMKNFTSGRELSEAASSKILGALRDQKLPKHGDYQKLSGAGSSIFQNVSEKCNC